MRYMAWKALITLSLILSTSGCSTEPKVLGPQNINAGGGANNGLDTVAIEFALRDTPTGGDDERTVVIQAREDFDDGNLETICEVDGTECACQFFSNSIFSSSVAGESLAVNGELNTLSCEIPVSITDPADITHIRITQSGSEVNSGAIKIKEVLLLGEVLGPIESKDVNKIFRYNCTRLFLEGSGISLGTIACPNDQFLSFLKATFHFYLFQQVDLSNDNFAQKGESALYNAQGDGNTCGQQITQSSCGPREGDPRYGLTAIASAKFRIAITLTSGPEPDGQQVFVGFAATTDNNLNCPPGLVKIRPFQAFPSTHTDPTAPSDSSNFVNSDGSLNDTILEVGTNTEDNFLLEKQENTVVCTDGVCPAPNGGAGIVQNVAYDPLSPQLCAIPEFLLTDL